MPRALRVLHVSSGDLWAGAEVQAFTLMTQLKGMPDTEVAAVVLNAGTLFNSVRTRGIESYLLDERQLGSHQLFGRLYRLLGDWQPDVIHTHREKENILGALAARCRRSIPSVRTVHGGNEHASPSGWKRYRRGLVTGIDRLCGRELQQRIIAVTRDLGKTLMEQFSPEKVVVIENGIDFEAVRAARAVADFRESAPECVHVGIVGRLVPVKRVDLFLEAASRLRHEHAGRPWRFHVFGDGPLRGELEGVAAALDVAGVVTFHGHREDIASCMGGLDALVICSDHEGMPMAALEAAALDVPTAAHAVGGLIDVTPPEFQVLRHDAAGYRDGILRSLEHDAREIARRRSLDVQGRLSARRNAERVRDLYEEVVREHGSSAQSMVE